MGGSTVSDSIDPRIAEILKQIAELPKDFEMTGEQRLRVDLGIDSLKLIDVVIRLEEELNIDLGDGFSRDFETVTDLDTYVIELAAR